MSQVSMQPIASQFDKSVTSTALSLLDLGFTDAEINTSDLLIVSGSGADARYSMTTTAPTAGAGHPLLDGAQLHIQGTDILRALKFISQSGTVKLQLSLFAWG